MLRSELGLSYLSRSATNALSVHTIFFSEAYEEQELLNMCIIPVCISADVFALNNRNISTACHFLLFWQTVRATDLVNMVMLFCAW